MSCTEANLRSYLHQVRRINSQIESEMTSIRKLLPKKNYNKPQDKIKSDKDIKKYFDHYLNMVNLRKEHQYLIDKVVSCESKINFPDYDITNVFENNFVFATDQEEQLKKVCSPSGLKAKSGKKSVLDGCNKKICKKDIYEDSTCPESDFLNEYIIPYPLGKAIVFPLVIIGLIVGIIVLLIVKSSQNTSRGGPMIQF